MGLGAKFKLLNTLTIAYVLQGLGLHEFFTIFYSFTIQARSQFSTPPVRLGWSRMPCVIGLSGSEQTSKKNKVNVELCK